MPIIKIQMAEGRTEETKQNLVKKLTKTLANVLNVEKSWITITISEFKRENWATAGELHSLKYGEGFGKE